MNKTLLLTGASAFALVLGLSAPAYADDGARAESSSSVDGNTSIDNGSLRDNLIDNSWNNGATGIVHDQQNNGSNNAMGAATAVHADVTGGAAIETGGRALTDSDFNESSHTTGEHEPDRNNEIIDTMIGFVGSATLQQNNGDNNGINAATALDGIDGNTDGGAYQEATATGDTEGNLSIDFSSERDNLIDPSFNGANGVFTVQQNNGDNNAISAATAALGITGNADGLKQDVKADAQADDNTTGPFADERENLITDSFNDGFAGVATVQQNNGDANGMAAATAVAGVGGDAGELEQHAIANPIGDGSFGNDVASDVSDRENQIGGDNPAFNGATGVMTVQQNNGDANGIAAATAVAGAMGGSGDIHQGTGVSLLFSGAAGNAADDENSTRLNWINSNSFTEATGVVTVQQNNGDANSMGAATAVTGVTEDSGNIDQHAMNGLFLTGSGWNGLEGDIRSGGNERTNRLNQAMHGMTGVTTVQQNNGNANHMGAATGVIGVGGTSGDIDQKIVAGTGWSGSASNEVEAEEDLRNNLISSGLNGYEGVLTVQQNNGDANNMVAMNAVTATSGAGEIEQDMSADNVSLDNDIEADDSDRNNRIDNSVGSPQGIATVQQNNGDANSIVAMTGVAAVAGDSGETRQKIDVWGASEDNDTKDEGKSVRTNFIDPSFDEATGIVTVQQNNGDNNAINAATGVRAEIGASAQTNPDEEDVSSQLAATSGAVVFSSAENVNPSPTLNDRFNLLGRAFLGGVNGVFTVQQNNGDNNAIGSATAVVADINNEEDVDSALNNRATTDGLVYDNLGQGEFGASDIGTGRRNSITRAQFDDAAGIITVQQNNGNNNVMGAATGVVANVDTEKRFGKQVSADADGTATVDTNTALADNTDRRNYIGDSFRGTQGVMTVQQNNGDSNVIGAATNVVASTELPGFGPAVSTSMLTASVTGNTTEVYGNEGLEWSNLVESSFTGASGIMTVQQNNGNGNGMGSAITAVANGITFGFNN